MAKKKNGRRMASTDGHRVLVVPDLHAPFVHRDALAFCQEIRDVHGTDITVFLGDEIDSHAISAWPKDADGMSAGQEFDLAVDCLKEWYQEFPDALVCNSNHTIRAWTAMKAIGLPKRFIPDIGKILEAPPGWEWKDHHTVGDVVFEHGTAGGGKYPYANIASANMKPTVIGHHHGAFGIWWHTTPHVTIFGMACGCLIDPQAYAFAYGKEHKTKPILGAGAVLDGQPILFKMFLNRKGRWDGKLRVAYEGHDG
jgi:hypothetical protein